MVQGFCQGYHASVELSRLLGVVGQFILLEKSGFHSPVQYLKMMEDKALPVISYYRQC